MKISISKVSTIKGEIAKLNLVHDAISSYDQLQVEIYDAGGRISKSRLGFGTRPNRQDDGSYEVTFDTSNLTVGFYEIKLIRLHTPINPATEASQIDFFPSKHFERFFFEIVITETGEITQANLSERLLQAEASHELEFLSGIDVSTSEANCNFCVFVLVKGLKISERYRLDRFEIVPLQRGLDSLDELEATNWFLKNHTKIDVVFGYNNSTQFQSQSNNPLSVIHFPIIRAENQEKACNFAVQKVNLLLQALSLTRGACAQIFDVVCINLNNNLATRFFAPIPYRGNLVTGSIAGENTEALINYLKNLESNSFKRFLVQLHKEAIQEDNIDFKFLRYWTILENLAMSKNYNEKDDLLDFENRVITKDGKPMKVGTSAPNNVFVLLKEHKIGSSLTTFDNVYMWFSLRNSVAHFGSISEWEKLERYRDYAQRAIEIITNSPGHNPILFDLKENVKLILLRELHEN